MNFYTQQIILFCTVLTVMFIITAVILRYLIPVLKSHKMGQHILDIGPRWHKSKEGTPTMGGLSFILASVPVMAGVAVYALYRGWDDTWSVLFLTYALAFCNGAVGIFDDYVKLSHKQNKGLTASQKYLLQLVVAGIYLFCMRLCGFIETTLYIPYLGYEIDFGIAYYVIALILITGIVNAVNLTDGVDGLASCVTAVVTAFFAVCAFMDAQPGMDSFVVLPALTLGACLGFLVYNFYPARVFMGDTGSLFLGAAVIGMAFLAHNPLIIVVAGFLYILECLSVMLQVFYFKVTGGKRLFRMAPIHHHFEKGGWSELRVVGVFSAFTALMCMIAFFGR